MIGAIVLMLLRRSREEREPVESDMPWLPWWFPLAGLVVLLFCLKVAL